MEIFETRRIARSASTLLSFSRTPHNGLRHNKGYETRVIFKTQWIILAEISRLVRRDRKKFKREGYSEKLRAIQPIGEHNSVLEMRQVRGPHRLRVHKATLPSFSFDAFLSLKNLQRRMAESFSCKYQANEVIVERTIFSGMPHSRA